MADVLTAYYNEHDPQAAAWLRELINRNLIAPGDVDERDIEDVRPHEVAEYTQCHFFAGIAGWSLALRQAGWSDDRPIWTGSCPCQPFSTAGRREGFNDKRHVWPALHWLISQCAPDIVVGEQVAGKSGKAWFDAVSTDLEGTGYTVGAAVTCACGIGAPHKRQRLYWMAHDPRGRRGKEYAYLRGNCERDRAERRTTRYNPSSPPRELAHDNSRQSAIGIGRNSRAGGREREQCLENRNGAASVWVADDSISGNRTLNREPLEGFRQTESNRGHSASRGLADNDGAGLQRQEGGRICPPQQSTRTRGMDGGMADCDRPGPLNGFWRDADWLLCRDAKWRPIEPESFPLADGIHATVGRMRPALERMGFGAKKIRRILRKPRSLAALASRNRVARLRGYGNAIVIKQAQAFIEAILESEEYLWPDREKR